MGMFQSFAYRFRPSLFVMDLGTELSLSKFQWRYFNQGSQCCGLTYNDKSRWGCGLARVKLVRDAECSVDYVVTSYYSPGAEVF